MELVFYILAAPWSGLPVIFPVLLCVSLNSFKLSIANLREGCLPVRLDRQGSYTWDERATLVAANLLSSV